MDVPGRAAAEAALEAAYSQISEVAGVLGEAEAMRASRCAGWTVLDVLYHQLLDARRALIVFATPAAGRPDTDYVSYWRPFSPASGGPGAPGSPSAAQHAHHVRIAALAYTPDQLAREWRDTADATVRAARACSHAVLATQGHTLATSDFIATLAVEAGVHYLDMTVALLAASESGAAPLALTRQVLDALAGDPLPDSWDDVTCALKGTGRLPITPADRTILGPVADHFPLFG